MQFKTSGIILKNIRIGDKKIISKIYTESAGLQQYSIQFGSSSKSKIRPAHIQPLNLVELDVIAKENRDIGRVQEIRIAYPYRELNFNVLKNCISVFLNEVLIKSIKESESNPELFLFIRNALIELDAHPGGFGGWHLYFLIELARRLGFYPQENFSQDTSFFNLLDGRFEFKPPPHVHYFDKNESMMFQELMRDAANYRHAPPPFETRSRQLELILRYFNFHVPGCTDFKSLPVLQATLRG
jgi:DNA repair protein RecO (recombination protein O)